jgi:hypothetical protein
MPFSSASENTERSATVGMGVGIDDNNSSGQVQNVRGNSSVVWRGDEQMKRSSAQPAAQLRLIFVSGAIEYSPISGVIS